MIQKIKASSYGFYAICLWNKDYLWAGWEDKSIKLIDLNNFKFVKTLNSHKNNIVTIKKIQHEKYGNFIISQDDDVGRKGKATIKLWGNKYKYT